MAKHKPDCCRYQSLHMDGFCDCGAEPHLDPEREPLRWHADVDYRTDAGVNTVPHDFSEIADLHNFIERGPNFYTIERITITPQGPYVDSTLTVEKAETL